LLFGLTLELLFAGVAAAQGVGETAYTAEVVSAEAVARCGPTDKFYPTNRLRPGERLQVLGSVPGGQYLRIVPPKGSFSWVETRFVRQMYPNIPNYVVSEPGSDAPVCTGSEFEEQSKHHPSQESCKLKWGTQVRAVGAPHKDDAGTWLPIEPPPAEVRYVLASSVKRVADAVAVARPSSPPADAVAAPIPAAKPAVVPVENTMPSALAPLQSPQLTLFQQAQEDERQGTAYSLLEAIKLYDRVAQEAATTDRNLAVRARDAANRVRQRQATFSPARNDCLPANTACGPTYDPPQRIYPMPVEPAAPPNVRLNAPAPTAPAVTPTYQTASASAPAPSRPPEGPGVYSERGYLKLSGRNVEGKRTYRLESPTGYPLMYVTAQSGVDLEAYLNHYVEVIGPAIYSGMLRANYMTATRVQPLQ
jgi:hypothetical protein